MRVDDLIQSEDSREELSILADRCAEFIEESGGHPLLKNLSNEYGDFHKVKVRKRKRRKQDPQQLAKIFNETFEDEIQNLRERAIFANGIATFTESVNEDLEPFYIFPTDGYEFMYSQEVENSSQDYKTAFDAIFEEFGTEKGNGVMKDLLKFTYTSDNLAEGINSGSEIIIYNIPFFYAIRAETVNDYDELITNIQELKT